MLTTRPDSQDHDFIEPLIALARCSIRDRILVIGARSAELMFELHRRGYLHVSTGANSPGTVQEYNVALVDWRGRSIKTIGPTLNWLRESLDQDGIVLIWVDGSDPQAGKVQAVLRKCKLTIQAGAVRDHGTAISACCGEAKWRPRPL
jgi:hypothetical protein